MKKSNITIAGRGRSVAYAWTKAKTRLLEVHAVADHYVYDDDTGLKAEALEQKIDAFILDIEGNDLHK